jgi:hypothetical protein
MATVQDFPEAPHHSKSKIDGGFEIRSSLHFVIVVSSFVALVPTPPPSITLEYVNKSTIALCVYWVVVDNCQWLSAK